MPGFISLKLLKYRTNDREETLLLSIGLSTAFLMFLGLIINESYPLAGVLRPFDLTILMMTLNIITILSVLLIYFKENETIKLPNFGFSKKSLVFFILLLFTSFFGLFGVIEANVTKGNSFLLLTIFIISILFSFAVIFKKKFSSGYYFAILLSITISLLGFVNSSLMTNYIVGSDTNDEFYAFRLLQIKSRWDLNGIPEYNFEILKSHSMASMTFLPLIYSQIMNLDGTWVYKILYPIFAVFSILALYKFFRIRTKKETAFLAVFYFITVCIGVGWGSDKQLIAQLFYVLLFYIIFKKEIPSLQRKMLFIIFSAALVISHYTLAYIFLLLITFIWASGFLLKIPYKRISLSHVIIFFTLTFSWNIYVARSASFFDFVRSLNQVYDKTLTSFFEPEARGTTVLQGLGISEETLTIMRQISRYIFLLTEFFVAVSVLKSTLKFITNKKSKLDLEYFMLKILNFALILINILLPGMAATFLMVRFYQTALLVLAPSCIFGGKEIFRYILKLRNKNLETFLMLIVLTSLFLFQTDFVYYFTGEHMTKVALGMSRISDVQLYTYMTNEPEVFGVYWFSEYTNTNNSLVYADGGHGRRIFTSYGLIPWGSERIRMISNTSMEIDDKSFIYLRGINILDGLIQDINPSISWNISAISPVIEEQNKIYSNGKFNL